MMPTEHRPNRVIDIGKTFKKKVLRSGLLKDLRRKRHHVKPSEARQLKAKEALRRARSEARKRAR